MIATIGYPDNLIETVAVRGHAYVKIRSRSLQLQYYGRGQINVDNHFETGTGWTVTTVWPDVANQAPAYSGPEANDAYLLMTSEPMALQELATRLLARHETDPAMLDRVAERIRVSLDPPDNNVALRLLSRLLGASGNPRYADVLELVVRTTRDSDLKNEAEDALKKLDGGRASALR